MIEVDLDKIRPMIAMPFHPSNTYTIEELNANLMDILDETEKRAKVSLDGAVDFTLKNKVKNGKFIVTFSFTSFVLIAFIPKSFLHIYLVKNQKSAA